MYLAAVNNYYTYTLLKYNHPTTARVRDTQLIYIRIQSSYVYILSANAISNYYTYIKTYIHIYIYHTYNYYIYHYYYVQLLYIYVNHPTTARVIGMHS